MFNNQDLTLEAPKLRKFAMRLTRNKHNADDLLQSTLLRAIEKKHLFKEGTDLFKWTSKMMYNLFVTGYRRRVKFETQYDPESYIEKQYVDADQEKKVKLRRVNDAITQLSNAHREVMIMVCIQGMAYQDVAEALNIPVGTVRSRLSRAREQLQTLLDTAEASETFTPSRNMNLNQEKRNARLAA